MDVAKNFEDLRINEEMVQVEENLEEKPPGGYSSSEEKVKVAEEKKSRLPGGFMSSVEGEKKCLYCLLKIQADFSNMNEEILCVLHIKLSPFCPKAQELPKKGFDSEPPKRIVLAIPDAQPCSGFFWPEEAHTNYRNHDDRVRSFNGYNGPIKREDLMDSGFYLNPPPIDKVTCFWCDGSLEGWNEGENPRLEHAKYYPGCSYLRKILGTDEIYKIRADMKPNESQAAENLRYNSNTEFLYEYYPAYKDVNVRIRSLVAGGLADNDAVASAVQGFHWSEGGTIECYYCGLHLTKATDLNKMREYHGTLSPFCTMIKDSGSSESNAAQEDKHEYVVFKPCGCLILAREYDSAARICPKLNCKKEVTSIVPCQVGRVRRTV